MKAFPRMFKYCWYWLIILEVVFSFSYIRLYNTGIFDKQTLAYDCLNYYVRDDIVRYYKEWIEDQQIIPYCIRPFDNEIELNEIEGPGILLRFDKLRQLNVSSRELLEWSAPIDLIEKYQMYLDENNCTYLFNETFLNCSSGWFGSNCEYTFFSDDSFDEIVHDTFYGKKETIQLAFDSITIHTCYIHLKCDRGPEPICLDWREICNGHIDCLNDGIDEENCFQLEEYQCNEGEYRCLNGQCISGEFFHDNERNPDCLDRSDEKYPTEEYTHKCFLDPSFRCEETICRHSLEFVCGDGECISDMWRWPESGVYTCFNHRKYLLDKITFDLSENSHLSRECWLSLICVLNVGFLFENLNCYATCRYPRNICLDLIREYCPKEFLFPSYPIILGHVYFAFKNDSSYENAFPTPDYICFNQSYCPFISTSILIQNRTCQLFNKLNMFTATDWSRLFPSCLSNFQSLNRTYCDQSHMYQCHGSYKCISKYRLVDGTIDCYERDDEYFNSSCLLNQTYRFQCSFQTNKCISPINVQDSVYHCPNWEDEKSFYTTNDYEKIPFPMLCDGFIDMRKIFDDEEGETDETHCEYWPCINQYTRCNGILNCIDGADELNCESTLCPANSHSCISVLTYNISCLPLNRYGDGNVDCLGGTDEPQYCRNGPYPLRKDYYQCQNSTICLYHSNLCDQIIDCPNLQDDEKLCRNDSLFQLIPMCDAYVKDYRTAIQEFLCEKFSKPSTIVFFQLENSTMNSSLTKSIESKSKRRLNINVRRHWLCNRGILIYRGLDEEEICLCPPSYYGSRCQYQNQRVSLTLRIRTGQTRISLQLLIMLIDSKQEIHSFEQRQFLFIRDCRSKFHFNLLYKTRSKQIHNQTYFIRIDIYNKLLLKHQSTWLYPLKFLFLPVQRLSIQLSLDKNSFDMKINCPLNCIHGQCRKYHNQMNYFCQCYPFYSGFYCEKKHECQCSSDSLCINSFNNQSICICSINKYGRLCRLNHQSCQNNPCLNGGTCISMDERISMKNFTCICEKTYSGSICERYQSEIIVSFEENFSIPSSIFVHFIRISSNSNPIQTTDILKIGFAQNTAIIYRSEPFNMIIIQIGTSYYFVYHENVFHLLTNYSIKILSSSYCLSINHFFNQTILQLPILHRIKYYHLLCQKHLELKYFHDNNFYICLCNSYRHANCFEFNFQIDFQCNQLEYCLNNGSCFHNNPICPTTIICSCPECYHGSQCQLHTHTFILSLDVILGYHIHSKISFFQQPLPIRISAILIILLTIIGLVSSILSIITFQSQTLRKVGCGIYLYVCSIDCLLIMISLNIKYWFLILFQMNYITNSIIIHTKIKGTWLFFE